MAPQRWYRSGREHNERERGEITFVFVRLTPTTLAGRERVEEGERNERGWKEEMRNGGECAHTQKNKLPRIERCGARISDNYNAGRDVLAPAREAAGLKFSYVDVVPRCSYYY